MHIIRQVLGLFAALWVGLVVPGCGNLLPSSERIVQSPFKSYAEAEQAFDLVVLGQSTSGDLVRAGYAAGVVPNIRVLTYLDIMERFLSQDSVRLSDLDPAVQNCLRTQVRCTGLEANPGVSYRRRNGNVILDVLDFKRNSQETGWRGEALFVMLDDVVIFKLWSGVPKVDKVKSSVKPLGPFQNIGSILNSAASEAIEDD